VPILRRWLVEADGDFMPTLSEPLEVAVIGLVAFPIERDHVELPLTVVRFAIDESTRGVAVLYPAIPYEADALAVPERRWSGLRRSARRQQQRSEKARTG